jgi:excisionase family DNA binding protein
MQEKRLLTTGDVATYCCVHVRTVIRWIDRGLLKAHQLPGRGDNRIAVADLLAFLHAHAMPIPDELRGRNQRVLIVEDDPNMAAAIQRVLRQAKFDTCVALDGFQAGSLLGTYRPLLMTLDLRMPGIPGLDVLKFVRLSEALKQTKILVISALPQGAMEEAIAAGADATLPKPFENQDLLDKVARLAGIDAVEPVL